MNNDENLFRVPKSIALRLLRQRRIDGRSDVLKTPLVLAQPLLGYRARYIARDDLQEHTILSVEV